MVFAFISDIHGNASALLSVLTDIKSRNVAGIFCCGDLVNYGPDPAKVIEIIASESIPTVMGNRDREIAMDYTLCSISPGRLPEVEQAAFTWTKGQLKGEHLDFLRNLPVSLGVQLGELYAMVTHATPWSDEHYASVCDIPALSDALRRISARALFFGHTHLASWSQHDQIHLVNVGSVGRPKDGDPRAAYVVFDTASYTPHVVRVAYPVEDVAEAMERAGLPRQLSDSLRCGRDYFSQLDKL
ncbi:MAG: metallophosphoesterase family protein [Bacillota bacterium]